MRLAFSEEQELIRDAAARLFDRHGGTDRGAFPDALWRDLAAGGWLELAASGDGIDLGILMTEAGRAGSNAPLADLAVLPGLLLDIAGRQTELAALTAGQARIAAAFEPFSDGAPVRAVRGVEGWRLTGRVLSPGGGAADRFLVAVEAGDGETGVFLIDAATPGLSVETYAAMDGGWSATLTLADADVAPAGRLGTDRDDFGRAIAVATSCACSEAAGLMAFLVGTTTAYALQRRQFGRPIASFQAIEHRLARMQIAAEEVLALALLAAIRLDDGAETRDLAVSKAKAKIGALSRFVAQSAVQIHGGMGVSEELRVAHFFRRLMTFEARFGNTRDHLGRVVGFVAAAPSLGHSLIDDAAQAV